MALNLENSVATVALTSGQLFKASWVAPGGSNRVLIVPIIYTYTATPTGMKYAGVSMSLIDSLSYSNDERVDIYGLIAPSTGTNDLEAVATGISNINAVPLLYTGAHQTTAWRTSSHPQDTSTTPTASDITSQIGDIVIGALATYLGATATITPSQTELIQENHGSADVSFSIVTEAGSSGTSSIDWTLGVSRHWSVIGLSLIPDSGGGGGGGPTTMGRRIYILP